MRLNPTLRWLKGPCLVAGLLPGLISAAAACDTALLLAIDISGSIDAAEYDLQIRGLAEGLEDPEIVDALVAGQSAIAVVQWSGIGAQAVVIPWQRIFDAGDAARLSAAARALPRSFRASETAVGQAIDVSAAQFPAVADCRRKVIDISGDGPENVGFTVGQARQRAEVQGIEINAIAIEDMGVSTPITNFYLRWAVTKGGFVITARGLRDYPRAMREKLLRELTKPAA